MFGTSRASACAPECQLRHWRVPRRNVPERGLIPPVATHAIHGRNDPFCCSTQHGVEAALYLASRGARLHMIEAGQKFTSQHPTAAGGGRAWPARPLTLGVAGSLLSLGACCASVFSASPLDPALPVHPSSHLLDGLV